MPVFEPNYLNATRLLAYKEVDIAFLCSGPYVIGKERYGLEAIAAIKPSNNVEYRAYIIVPANSKVTSLKGLKGKSFSYVDLLSYSGRLVPMYMIKKMGEDPLRFFSDVQYTKSHEASLKAVAEGKVDGTAVISLLVEHELRINPALKKQIKIIEKSAKTGYPVFATVKFIDKELTESIRKVLLNMHRDKKGKEILKKLNIDYLFQPKDSEYDLIRQHYRELKEFVP